MVAGILNLLHHMGLWSEPQEEPSLSHPVLSQGDQVAFLNAEASGIFLTEVHNNIVVDEGEEIGAIVSPLTGDVLESVKGPCHGLLFTIRAYPVVYQGSLLARIHRL